MTFRTFEARYSFSLPLAIVSLYLMLSTVWMPGIAPRLYDDARYLELGMLALLLVAVLIPKVRDAVTLAWLCLDIKSRTLLVILLAGGVASTLVSGAIHLGLLEIALLAQLVLLILIVSAVVRESREEADKALAIAIFSGAALCVLKFWVTYVLYAVEGKIFPWDSPFIDFANVRFFSQYQSYTLLLVTLPAFLLPAMARPARALFFFIAANFWALHWMVGTRAAWLGLVVGTAFVLMFRRQGRLAWLRKQLFVALAGAAIFLIHSHIVARLPDLTPVPGIKSIVERGQDSINERLALAKSALVFIREHPLLGVGPGQFGLQPYSTFAAHPHNVPLQLLSEYGLPTGLAGITLGMLLVLFAVRSLKIKPGTASNTLNTNLVAALIMGLTDSLFSGNLIMPHSQVVFGVLAGWILGRNLPNRSGLYENGASFRNTRFTIVSIGILATGITTILALEYLPLVRGVPPDTLTWNPHFWQYGRFAAW